nr:DUF488 family protein [Pleomorphomonas oryzae]
MARFPLVVARVYDPLESMIGARLLVDRLWPRGISKERLRPDDWPKEVTPSTALRKWFHAGSGGWAEFRERYEAELATHPTEVEQCVDWCRKGPVTLLTAAQDPEQSHAAVLRDWMDARLKS